MLSAIQRRDTCLPEEWMQELAGNLTMIRLPTSRDSGLMLEEGIKSPTSVTEAPGLRETSFVATGLSNTDQNLGFDISHLMLKVKTEVLLSPKKLRVPEVRNQPRTKVKKNKVNVVTVKNAISTPQNVGV